MNYFIKFISTCFLFVLISCFVPDTEVAKKKVNSTQEKTSSLPLLTQEGSEQFPIYYKNYRELCNSVWQSQDKKTTVEFGAEEKDIILIYEDKRYPFIQFDYYDGIFKMETALQNPQTYTPWSIVLVMRPQSQNEAWFNLFGGTISVVGTLNRIK